MSNSTVWHITAFFSPRQYIILLTCEHIEMLIPISSIYSLGCVRKFIYLWLYYAFRFFPYGNGLSIKENQWDVSTPFDPFSRFFQPSVKKKSSYNEHAYFASVFQVCDVRHVWRKLSPQPARLDPNQKRNNLDISHLRRVGAGIFMFLPFAGKRVMPNVQINIAHRVGVMVIKSITIFILLSA